MKTNTTSKNRTPQKHVKQEKKSPGTLRAFSIVLLLLMALSTFGRIAAANHRSSLSDQASTQQAVPAGGGGMAARVLVFHREDRVSSLCEDLVITAGGDAVYATCETGAEKQYTLSETERQQVQTWIKIFKAVNYDHKATSPADGAVIQLYLNGQGPQQATGFETQQMIDFANILDAKIASQS